MADKIIVNTEALQDIAARLNRLAHELTDESDNVLHASRMPDYCGHRTAPNRCRLQAVSFSCGGRTIEDSLGSYSRGMNSLSRYVQKLAKDVQRVSDRFTDMENDISQLVDRGLPEGLGAALGIAGQFADAPILGPGGQMQLGLNDNSAFSDTASDTSFQPEIAINVGNPFQNTMDWLRQYVQEAVRKARERAQQYADANKLRIFDGEGQYGADQGAPRKDKARYDMYRDIIRENTGKELKTDDEVQKYLSDMNQEGCSYSAMVNAIFLAYEGRAEDFERDFGFPMYHNGDLDYNRLYVDVYSTTDNYSKVNGKYVYNEGDSGASLADTRDRMEMYLSEHGVDCKVKNNVKITPDNYAEYAEKGSIHISVGQPFYMYDSKGNHIKRDGGHRMTITGVENGRYVVSSWGKTYYVDPADPHGRMNFQMISIDS